MPATIVETYPTLWHYTTAAGLEGILKSQQLWATNIRYLNDDEEFRGFFERKLPTLLSTGIDDGIAKLGESRLTEMLKIAGDVDGIKHTFFEGLHSALTTVTLQQEAYITSFCYTPTGADSEDGLLSQWRGYGHDGGFAIVLDTKELNELIKREQEQYKYPFLNFSDVDYHYENWVNDTNRYEETVEWERIVQEKVSQMVVEGDFIKHAEDIFIPLLSLAIRHKHHGFKEEREIRIAAVRWSKNTTRTVAEYEDNTIKAVNFYPRSGILVPYISLFDGIPSKERKLPIKEIVIGPHHDKLKRQQAVQMLINELDIDATVRVSDIPFLGR